MNRPRVIRRISNPTLKKSIINTLMTIFKIDDIPYSEKAYEYKLRKAISYIVINDDRDLTDAIILDMVREAINNSFNNNLLSKGHKDILITMLSDILRMNKMINYIYARCNDALWQNEVMQSMDNDEIEHKQHEQKDYEPSYVLPSQHKNLLTRLSELNTHIDNLQRQQTMLHNEIVNMRVLT